MSLKKILGEDLYEQVSDKLDKDTELIVNDGSYIPREKYNAKTEKIDALEEQIEQRDSQIEQLKEDTNTTDELKQKIEELQEKNESTQQEWQEKLQQTMLQSAIDKKLLKENARNPKAVKALLDMDEVKLDGDDVRGLDNQIESLKENDDYLFESNNNKNVGKDSNPGGDNNKSLTMQDVDNMTEDEINANWDEVSKVLSK